MIDEKKLIRDLNDTVHSPETIINIPKDETTQDIIDMALKAYRELMFKCIENQPKVGEWIPVSKRLPVLEGMEFKEDGFYSDCGRRFMITDVNGYVYASAFYLKANKFDDAAVAWMPIPEPYKEDENA